MDRNKIQEIMRAELEDFEELREQSKAYIKENEKDLKDRFCYAEYLEKPVKENQLLFWNGNGCTFDGIPRAVFENLYRQFGESCIWVWVKKEPEEEWEEAPEGISFVKKNSPEYWEALAVSGCLFGDGSLPVPFVKRREQLYFNVYRKPEETGIDALSLYRKELDRTDCLFLRPADKALAEQGDSARAPERKKVLVLTNGREERAHRLLVKHMLRLADREKYDFTVLTPRLMSPALEAEFEELPEDVYPFIYRGRMTVTEQDFLLLRILEKHPGLYADRPEIREFVNGLMETEWRRIWGEGREFDCVVLAGQLNVQQLYMAQALSCETRVLVDMDFLAGLKERAPEEWERAVSLFDRVYERTDPEIQRIQSCIEAEAPGETVEFHGETLRVFDAWKCDHHRTARRLVRL